MNYTINQINNKFNLNDEGLLKARKIYENLSVSFKGPLTIEDFKHLEMEHFEDINGKSQFFYLTSNNGDIVSTCEIVPRKGYHENSLNLLLSMVYTNPNYRKKGLVSKLLNWVIKFYENQTIDHDDTIIISESITNKECMEYFNEAVPLKFRESNNINWSLYSIVGTFYQQFGFNPCDEINWFQINSSDFPNEGEFQINETNEKLLTNEDIDDYYFNEKYNFTPVNDTQLQNCSLEESSYAGFVARYQSYIEFNKDKFKDDDIKFAKNCGFYIKEIVNGKEYETIAFICPFFFMNRIVINRIFTNVEDETIFTKHWERITKFVSNYAQNVWKTIPGLETYSDSDKLVMTADNDIVVKSENLNVKNITDIIKKSTGWEDVGLGMVLPMIRDWKSLKSPPSKLAHNGHWSFM